MMSYVENEEIGGGQQSNGPRRGDEPNEGHATSVAGREGDRLFVFRYKHLLYDIIDDCCCNLNTI